MGQEIVDSCGINRSLSIGIRRILKRLMADPQKTLILLDGKLVAPAKYTHQKTIPGGEQRRKVIALASIVAKVRRDRRMVSFSKKYSQYGFERHKGYGTKDHFDNIQKYGICRLHRKSYLKNLQHTK